MKAVNRKRYSSDFIDQAVALVSLGRTVPDVAQELGIGTSILYRWTQSQRQGQRQGSQLGSAVQSVPHLRDGLDEAAELRRLRKENARLLLENDILKKAAVILGTQPQNKPAR